MQKSLWENNWLFSADTIIVGSGIVGLSCASAILEAQPSHKVIILERGLIPTGASTRNAGFASFLSYYENLELLEKEGAQACFNSAKEMYGSLVTLRKRVGEANMDFRQDGTYDIFTEDMLPKLDKIKVINDILRPIFNDDAYYLANEKIEEFGMNKDIVKALVFNKYDGQIDTGKTMLNFQKYVGTLGGKIITGAEVTGYKKNDNKDIIVDVKDPLVKGGIQQFRCQNLVFCTDAYSGTFFKGLDIYPVRGQVLVTGPIKDLKMKGNFLYHNGYFYIRDYHGRILIGGGTIPFWEEESVSEAKTTPKITGNLRKVLEEVLLPGQKFTIEHEWAGIMCFGKNSEMPLVSKIENNIYMAIRMAGDGVARSSMVAGKVKDMVLEAHQIKPKL